MSLMFSSGLLAASLLLGQPGSGSDKRPALPPLPEPQGEMIMPVQNTIPPPPTLPPQPQPRPILGFFSREDRPILSKIQSWFKRDDQQSSPPGSAGRGTVIREAAPPLLNSPATPATSPTPSGDFPRRMPNPNSMAPAPTLHLAKEIVHPANAVVKQASTQEPIILKDAKSPIRPELAVKIGRDEKFAWMTGQFEIENGAFVLYYATPETVDKFHGRIVLMADKADLKQFHRGDLVSVHGQLAQGQTMQGVVPTYHVTTASLIDRPKQ